MPNLESLEFEEARFDSPPLPALQHFTRLRRLKLTAVPEYELNPTDINVKSERFNVGTLLRAASSNVSYLEVAGDLVDLASFTSVDWPKLHTLVISGHQPDEPYLPLASIVARMPKLVELSLISSALYGFEVPHYLSHPPDKGAPFLASVAPQLKSLTMSNVSPEDEIFDHLPSNLTRLRVLALRDSTLDRPVYPWNPYSPLSLERVYDILENVSHLPHLIELSLTIIGSPSPDLISDIATACPDLSVLRLEEEKYENVEVDEPSEKVSPLRLCGCSQHLTTLPSHRNCTWNLYGNSVTCESCGSL